MLISSQTSLAVAKSLVSQTSEQFLSITGSYGKMQLLANCYSDAEIGASSIAS